LSRLPAWQAAALGDTLEALRAQHLLRHRRTVEVVDTACAATDAIQDGTGPVCRVDGAQLVNFCSNDYLGLAQHPALREAMSDAARRHGVGAGASHLVTGHHPEHTRLEEALAAYTHREAALLFSTGYMANLAIAQVLVGRGARADHAAAGTVVSDELNHASLIDGARLAGRRILRFAHADAAAAESTLVAAHEATGGTTPGPTVLVTDGLFSMDGDVAPVHALAAACARHESWLAVDDAHGLGVSGPTGRGTLEAAGLLADPDAAPVLMGTLGKAFGAFGAFIAGRRELVELFRQRARSYIFTTALPPAVAAAAREGLRLADAEPERRVHLNSLISRFRHEAAGLGLADQLLPSHSPIQPLVLGQPAVALAASAALQARGLLVGAIRPPTVPAGSARLRITFSAAHTHAQLDQLLDGLAAVLPGNGLAA
jgi:8-amino-7-oxononanoate synthase